MTSPRHWLIRYTDKLMRLTGDLTREQAAEFVGHVWQAGHEAGIAEAAEEARRDGE